MSDEVAFRIVFGTKHYDEDSLDSTDKRPRVHILDILVGESVAALSEVVTRVDGDVMSPEEKTRAGLWKLRRSSSFCKDGFE